MRSTPFAAVLASFLMVSVVSARAGDAGGQGYVIQQGDTLARVAMRFYRDADAYPRIVEATNARARTDPGFRRIESIDLISVGDRLWIPDGAEAHGVAAGGADTHGGGAHWSYSGMEGPAYWGGLDAGFGTCATGRAQSPVNIPSNSRARYGEVTFDYRPSTLSFAGNGHTVEVSYDSGSSITLDGQRYALRQFHFHTPSENTIDGVQSAMEMHLVHAGPGGRLAVVAVLFDISGRDNPFLGRIWPHLPQPGRAKQTRERIDIAAAFDLTAPVYRFQGSLTTPPCTENVTWLVMKTHEPVSRRQVGALVSRIGLNARPTQPLNDRVIGAQGGEAMAAHDLVPHRPQQGDDHTAPAHHAPPAEPHKPHREVERPTAHVAEHPLPPPPPLPEHHEPEPPREVVRDLGSHVVEPPEHAETDGSGAAGGHGYVARAPEVLRGLPIPDEGRPLYVIDTSRNRGRSGANGHASRTTGH